MLKTKRQLVLSRSSVYGGTNGKKYITIHETGNERIGADAEAHANLQSNGYFASWHWSVDDKEAIQSFEHDVQCWHAGDGRGDGNLNSIGIEICVNSDGDFLEAVTNTAELVRKIMKEENISLSNLVQHNRWSGKNCPRFLRLGSKGVTWTQFKKMVSNGDVKPSKPSQDANLIVDGKWGPATTRALQGVLGTVVDGLLSGQVRNASTNALYGGVNFGGGGSMVIRALQVKVGANVDGLLGPNTVRAMQGYLNTPVDGIISRPASMMVKEMQRRLNNNTF